MIGVSELIAVLSGGQWLVCVSYVRVSCCSVRRPMVGVCELV